MVARQDENLIELIAIKKLLILGLLRSGMTQSQVGSALGLDRSNISRMFPKGALKDISKTSKPEK